MQVPLPHMFIVKASPSSTRDEERFVLCISNYKEQNRSWKITIMDESRLLINNCVLMKDGTELESETYLHERDSSRYSEVKYYESCMKRTKRYIEIPGVGPIHEYKVSNPCKILSSKYYQVFMNKDLEMRWHFRIRREEPKIPIHVQNAYIEYALSKNEICPITLCPFERGDVACTPCGHLFSQSVIESLKVCPTCRRDL